jgi:EmrB/QacA subfamily drug resistance transporter
VSTSPPPAVQPDPRRWKALAFVALAQLMVVLDGTVVNIALPSAQRALGFSDADRQWVVTAYALPFGALLLLGGRIADRWGRKRAFLVGVIGFALASALGAVATDTAMLLGSRALQGCFGAMLAPAALSLVTVTFTEPAERAKAFGVWGSIAGGGAAVGLILGGFLTEYLSWRWTLLVNVVFAAVATAGAVVFVRDPVRVRTRARLDVVGAVLVSAGLACLVYGVSRAESDGWRARITVGLLIGAAVALILFVLVEAFSPAPLLPLRVVANRDRAGTYASLALAIVGMFLFLTYYLQTVRGMSPVISGVAFLPMVGGMLIGASQISARLMTRVRARALMPPGFLVAAVGMLSLARITASTPYQTWPLAGLVLLGFGVGCAFVPAMNVATGNVDPRDAGVASALVNTCQQIGGAVGTALLSTLALSATRRYAERHAGSAPDLSTRASVHGFTTAFTISAGFLIAAAVVAFVFIGYRGSASVRTATAGTAATVSARAPEAAPAPLPVAVGPAEIMPVDDLVPFPAQTHAEPDLTALAEGSVIHGRVRDHDGSILPMVAITALSAQGRQVGRARSADDGAYRLGVPHAGNYVLIAAAPGREPEAATVHVHERPVRHDILLTERGRVSVVVRTAGGTLLPGAALVLTDAAGELLSSRRTGADGSHTFRDLPVGLLTLAVTAVGHRPAALAVQVDGHGIARAEVDLAPAASLVGTVRAWTTDSPLADARVVLMDGAGNVVATADSDGQGGFAFADLDAGDYTLVASGYPPVASAVRVDGRGDRRYDIQLGHPDR